MKCFSSTRTFYPSCKITQRHRGTKDLGDKINLVESNGRVHGFKPEGSTFISNHSFRKLTLGVVRHDDIAFKVLRASVPPCAKKKRKKRSRLGVTVVEEYTAAASVLPEAKKMTILPSLCAIEVHFRASATSQRTENSPGPRGGLPAGGKRS